jgi:hypothetical protein
MENTIYQDYIIMLYTCIELLPYKYVQLLYKFKIKDK